MIQSYESIDEIKYTQEYDSDFPIVIILDILIEKKLNIPTVHAVFKRSKHCNSPTYLMGQD